MHAARMLDCDWLVHSARKQPGRSHGHETGQGLQRKASLLKVYSFCATACDILSQCGLCQDAQEKKTKTDWVLKLSAAAFYKYTSVAYILHIVDSFSTICLILPWPPVTALLHLYAFRFVLWPLLHMLQGLGDPGTEMQLSRCMQNGMLFLGLNISCSAPFCGGYANHLRELQVWSGLRFSFLSASSLLANPVLQHTKCC